MKSQDADGKDVAAPCEPAPCRFGAFEFDPGSHTLRRAGRRVRLSSQPARILALVVRRGGEAVTRDDIRRELWGDGTHVDFEQGINQAIRHLRAALGDDPEVPRYLETLPRLGYRWIAPVSRINGNESLPGRPPGSSLAAPAAADAPPGAPAPGGWRRAARSGLVPVISAAALVLLLASWARSPAPAARPMLAVLPFEEPAGAGSSSGVADMLTEELIGRVGRLYGGRMGVIARTSAMSYRGSGKGVPRIARELGATHVLEGSVTPAGSRLLIAARLVRVADQSPLWSASYDRLPHETPDLPSDLADRIARALALNLLSEEDRALPAARTSPEAWALYLEAKSKLAERRPDDALAVLQRVLTIDPGFAPAYVALARAGMVRPGPPREREPDVREALERALSLDDGLVEAHVMMGDVRFYQDFDTAAARREYERALRLNPASAEAWHHMAAVHSVAGRHEQAIDAVRRALSYDPVDPMVSSDVGWYFYWARQYEDAIEHSRRTLAIRPGFYWADRCILLAYLMKGDREAAARQALAVMRETEGGTILASRSGPFDPDLILEDFWRQEFEQISTEVSRRVRSPSDLGMVELARGRNDEALAAFERAYEVRGGWILPFLTVEPLADPLRGDTRFEALLARIRTPR